MRVEEIMGSPLVTVTPQTPLKQVGRLLVERRITGVPVVDDAGALLGVVSQTDLVREEQSAEAESLRSPGRLRRRLSRTNAAHHTAGDVMTSPVLTVEARSSAVGAAWLMAEHGVNRLVVTDGAAPIGVVTRTDLIRAFARRDEDVRREIVEEVLPSLEISPNDVAVTVSDGEVVLDGEVDDELQARWLPHAVRCVLGVVAVDARLRPHHAHRVDVLTPSL